jgi:LytS/YehU family sensor histidine kinase
MILVSGVKLYNLYQNAEFNLRKKEIETLKLEKEKAEAELKFYQSQLNPHFLFNTLNTLAGLIRLDPRQAEKMIEVLSDYYRAVLNLSNVMIIPLKNEILLVENYLKLLKIRFGNRLYYELDIQRKCENFPVPALILQPIVENSVKHGNRTTNGETRIIIHAALKEQYDEPVLILQVKDNGPGFDSIPVETSSGLSITYKKLKLLYKDKASINVKTENGAVVTIIIPFYRPGE